ncbi:MAG TPA: serine hydrolase domain-containing protein [Frateuria sp.]|uniref:serine hydrolase domain-containing protein n=1 Tax=Frateuria sp. TaxID=2211372 RepID=UPI002DE2162F|nr:serine hydrolase domain-containing protein [Frateuria sp.]
MQLRTLPLLIAGLLGAATTPASAHVPTTAAPDPTDTTVQALPPDRVKATLEDYRQWLDTLQRRDAVAGLATAVVVNDKVVFEGTIGYADAADKEPVKPDTVFRLASLSKAFATGLTAVLVQDGKLAWDTRLVNVLPFFKLKNVPDTQQATVADILGQRLGLPRNTYDNMLEDDVPYDELVRKLDEVDMACGVGKCYGYQNVAFSLIGDVVYAMTGTFFYKLVDQRIFLPLGMTTASYGRAGLESSRSWARPHRRTRRGWVPFEPKETYYRVAPAAGVNASLRDMEQWLIAQMGGRPDVLSPAALSVLHTPGVPTPVELHSSPWRSGRLSAAHYALGWRVFTYGGETLIYHAGAVEGYRTMIGFFPKYHAGVVTLWNAGVPTPSGLMPMVFDSLLGLPAVDWAGVEKDPPPASAPAKPSQNRAPRHRRYR